MNRDNDNSSSYLKLSDVKVIYVTIDVAAKLADVSIKTMYNYKKSGYLVLHKKDKRNYVYMGDIPIIKKRADENKKIMYRKARNVYRNDFPRYKAITRGGAVMGEDGKKELSLKEYRKLLIEKESVIDSLHCKIDDYIEESKELNNENKSLKAEIEELKRKSATDNSIISDLDRANENISRLTEEIQKKTEEIERLVLDNNELAKSNLSFRVEIDKAKFEIKAKNELLDSKNKEISSLNIFKEHFIDMLIWSSEKSKHNWSASQEISATVNAKGQINSINETIEKLSNRFDVSMKELRESIEDKPGFFRVRKKRSK